MSETRANKIEQLLGEVIDRRLAGEPLPDEQVVAEHPDLMPELAGALQRLRQVAETQPATATQPAKHPDAAADTLDARAEQIFKEAEPASDARSNVGAAIPGYEITRLLSRGGQGAVYQAVQTSTKRKVAIKLLLEGEFASPSVRKRFEREVELVAQLKHTNIISIFDSGQTAEGRQYAVMDYVRGVPLTKYVRDNKLTLEDALQLFNKVLDAVQYAHQKGVIHRDLKPSNILVDADGSPKVLDFGLAKQMLGTTDTVITLTEQVVGTLPYMSPEQTTGNPDLIDTRTDIYALGVILYELLTGQYPYPVVGNMADVLRHIAETDPTPPSRAWKAESGISQRSARKKLRVGDCPIDDEIQTITLKLLSKERERRYQSAGELRADIEHYLAGEPIEAKRDSGWYLLKKAVRRYRVPVAVLSTLLLFIVGSSLALSVMYQRSESQRTRADQKSAEAIEAAARAERNATVADERYQEIIRLADLKRLADARAAAEELWPAYPEKIEDIKAWLAEQAAPLRDNLPRHAATLAALRERALPYDPEQQRGDRQTHPRAAELAEKQARVPELLKQLEELQAHDAGTAHALAVAETGSGIRSDGDSGAGDIASGPDDAETRAGKIAEIEREIAELEEAVKERRTWKFSDNQTQWQHDTLASLVADLREFVDADPKRGTLASVEERLAFAGGIEERSVSGPEAAAKWAEAIADIARLEAYDGLQLKPQVGLLPLRRDPQSGLWEFWHIQTGAAPEPNPDPEAPSPWIMTGDTGLVFVLIPGGTFWMGAQKDDPAGQNYDPQAAANEGPVHEISLDQFFLSKYEMTQAQWQRFTGSNPSFYGPDWNTRMHQNKSWHPVEQVSWTECRDVLFRLGLVLPTEAQWEYAARAGSDTPWWTGAEKESIGTEQAGNLADDWARRHGGPSSWIYEDWEDGWVEHAPVGSFVANGFGLHDVIGNVWEWCRDGYAGYKAGFAAKDGLRKVTGARSRVDRGGSFNRPASYARTADRGDNPPEFLIGFLGVRPARIASD